MRHWRRAFLPKPATWIGFCFILLFSCPVGGLLPTVSAQSTNTSAQLQQAQGQLQSLQQTRQEQTDRRQRLLQEQKNVLDQQAQLRKEIPLCQQEMKKPLSPEQRDRAKCNLRDKTTDYERAKQQQTEIDQQVTQLQQQSTQTQQQLFQVQQQVTQLTQQLQQEQAAEARASDPLQRFMMAPAEPLSGLPLVTTPSGRRLIVLGGRSVLLTPGFTSTWDQATLTLTIDSGGVAPGFFANAYTFTMSDGSIQNVRVRYYRDSINPPVAPLGLLVTLGPTQMNAVIADTAIMFGPVPFSWPVPVTSLAHGVLDVPDDPSIQPVTIGLVLK